ncbi:MAG TPA: hypothetical protein VIR54_00615 [Vicinamibacterales bacterium]
MRLHSRALLAVTEFALVAITTLAAQGTTFQFYVAASNPSGAPTTDLRNEDILMSENGVQQQVVKVEAISIPVKLTIAVDNGVDSGDALAHYRTGLTGLVEALPPDVEVTLITIAPQPRVVVKSTDRTQIIRGINGFAPEQARPRFTDTIVEYSKELERESKNKNAKPYVPIMVMLSTAANESSSYQPKEIEKAVGFLVTRKARLNVVMMSTRTGQATSVETLNSQLQAIVAIPAVKMTNGRYEALAVSSRVATLLPEWGKDLAALHTRQANQFRVTVERKTGGPLQSPRIEIARQGLAGTVSIDGYLP